MSELKITVNIKAFMDSYLNIFSTVKEEELIEFFINLKDDKLANVLAMANGVHMMDCWLLWNEALALDTFLLNMKQECPPNE